MLERLRIGTRLGLGSGLLITASTLAVAAAAWVGIRSQHAIEQANDEAQRRVAAISAMRHSQLALVSAIRSAGLQTDAAAVNADVDAYRAALKAVEQQEGVLARESLVAEARAAIERAAALRKQSAPLVEEAIGLSMAFAGDEAAKVLSTRFAPLERKWAAELAELSRIETVRADAARASIAAEIRQHYLLLAALVAVVIAGGSAFAVLMTRSVTRPLREAVRVAQSVAAGDLGVQVQATGRDEAAELLQSLQGMAGQLALMVTAVRESAESIDCASREISSGNMDLSNRTEQQASSVQQTSATLDELTAMVGDTAGHAQTVSKLVAETADVAREGGETMQTVSQTMSRISDSSRRIADIIGVIDGIAFQTNILALNAAVEAARAGEQGRGFAVVASEVRALAQRVSAAAAEVRTLIAESVERVDAGGRQVGSMSQTMQALLGSVGSVHTLVKQISDASARQSGNIGQVNESVRTIDSTTQQNAALVEQVAAAAQSLSGQTEKLTGLVHRFKIAEAA